jgi:bacterioferritin (cytochrome b1)
MNRKVFDLLNQAREREIGTISQYMIHHYELEDKDFGKLSSKLK